MDPGKSLDYPDPGSGTGPETGSKWQCLDGHAAQRAGVQVPSYAAVFPANGHVSRSSCSGWSKAWN